METTKSSKQKRIKEAIFFLALRNAQVDSFLVNVIQCHHANPMRKLRGLLALTKAGKSVRTGQFDLDVLIVDGERENWTLLDVWRTPATA